MLRWSGSLAIRLCDDNADFPPGRFLPLLPFLSLASDHDDGRLIVMRSIEQHDGDGNKDDAGDNDDQGHGNSNGNRNRRRGEQRKQGTTIRGELRSVGDGVVVVQLHRRLV